MKLLIDFSAIIDVMSLLDNFNDELPEDLISGDLRIGDSPMLNSSETSNNLLNNNSTPPQQVSNTTPPQQQQQQPQNTQTNTPPQPIQQGSPVPNSNTLNQRPPLSSPQPPPSSISTSGDPTPTMPCVSSTPANNTAAAMAGNQRNSLQMMPLPSSGSTNQQMPNHSVPTNPHFASSSYNSMPGSPHPSMGHMGGPHVTPHMQHRMRHGGGIGPMRVGMPNQPHTMMHPGMSPHHGGIRPGMGGMVSHQSVAHRMASVPMPGGPQYMHQHPSGHHAMHPMVNPGMPNQQMGGPQNMHMMPTASIHGSMRSNMIHHGANQPHMGNMHGGQNPRFANPNAIRSGGMNMMQGDSQLFSGGGGGGGEMNMDRTPSGPIQRPNDVGAATNASRLPPPHNDISGGGGGGRMMLNTGQQQPQQQQPQQQQPQQQQPQQQPQQPQQQSQQQQQQQAMNATGQGVSPGGAANAIPPGMQLNIYVGYQLNKKAQ